MAKVIVNKFGVFGGQFAWRSVDGGQLTRSQLSCTEAVHAL